MNITELLKTINEAPISNEEMNKFMCAMDKDNNGPSIIRPIIIAKQVFGADSDKRISINIRLTAISKLIENGSIPGWVKSDQSDDYDLVAANIFMAAGLEPMILEPMIEDINNLGFNLESLLRRTFQLGKMDIIKKPI